MTDTVKEATKEYLVTKGNYATDETGRKGEGDIVVLTANQAKPLLKLRIIE